MQRDTEIEHFIAGRHYRNVDPTSDSQLGASNGRRQPQFLRANANASSKYHIPRVDVLADADAGRNRQLHVGAGNQVRRPRRIAIHAAVVQGRYIYRGAHVVRQNPAECPVPVYPFGLGDGCESLQDGAQRLLD